MKLNKITKYVLIVIGGVIFALWVMCFSYGIAGCLCDPPLQYTQAALVFSLSTASLALGMVVTALILEVLR